MSYTKPTMYQQADPLAFSKGFDAAFQKQQDAFKADLEERERIAKEADEALALAYSAADLGPINGIDAKFNDALQAGLNSIVENGDFANASASEKAKMLQQLKLKKSAFQRIGEIMGVDQEDWDLRNDPKLSAFRAAVLKGDPSIQVEANGLDFKIKGSFGEITLDDISNKRIINKAPYEESLNEMNGGFAELYQKSIYEAFKSGKTDQEIQLLREDFKKTYADRIKGLDPDMKEYLKYNVAKTNDESQMIDAMFDKFDSQITDPGLIYNRPQAKINYPEQLALNISKDVAQDPRGFFNRLGGSAGFEDVDFTKDGKITYNRPVKVKDNDGNEVIAYRESVLDLTEKGDFNTFVNQTFEPYVGSFVTPAEKARSFIAFKDSISYELGKIIADQASQPTQVETTTTTTVDSVIKPLGQNEYPEDVVSIFSGQIQPTASWAVYNTTEADELQNQYGKPTEENIAKYLYDKKLRGTQQEDVAKNRAEAQEVLNEYKNFKSKSNSNVSDRNLAAFIGEKLDKNQEQLLRQALGTDSFNGVDAEQLIKEFLRIKYNVTGDVNVNTLAGVVNKDFSS
jgi:hypothetical protein